VRCPLDQLSWVPRLSPGPVPRCPWSPGVGYEQVTAPQAVGLRRRDQRRSREDLEGLRAFAILSYTFGAGEVPVDDRHGGLEVDEELRSPSDEPADNAAIVNR